MPLAGWMLVKAHGLGLSYILVAALAGAVGNTLGSLLTYWIGIAGGRRVLEKWGRYVLISRHDLDLADRWFSKYGELVAFFSRLLPVVRTFISLPAGVARMPLKKFVPYTFVGAFIWSGVLAYGGYLLGEHWEKLRSAIRPFDIPIMVIVVALVMWFVVHKIRRERKDKGQDATPSQPQSPTDR